MSERVWIVDDNQMVLKILSDILVKNGYNAKEFNHPAEVIKRLLEADYDSAKLPQVMLVDYWLPDLKGSELIRTIRELGAPYTNISFVGITASKGENASEADTEFARLGVFVLRKPGFHESDLLIRVMRAQVERTKTGSWPIITPDEIGALKK